VTLLFGHISSLRYLGHCSLFIRHPSYLNFFPHNISFPHTSTDGKLEEIASKIGRTIARLHDGGLIHGDLTTSNMLLDDKTGQLVLIDFGLGSTSTLPEDKAVDLYVLERALLSMHSSIGPLMSLVLAAYNKSSKYWSSTLNKLAAVRMRGRKRVMVG
jgi:TP53 regulating kinase-like protein